MEPIESPQVNDAKATVTEEVDVHYSERYQSIIWLFCLIFGAIQFPWWLVLECVTNNAFYGQPVEFWKDSLIRLASLLFTFPSIIASVYTLVQTLRTRKVIPIWAAVFCAIVLIGSILLTGVVIVNWYTSVWCGEGWDFI